MAQRFDKGHRITTDELTLHETLRRLLAAVEDFETKTPKYRRIDAERQVLREAMTDAQLVLSVQKPTKEKPKKDRESLRSIAGRTPGITKT